MTSLDHGRNRPTAFRSRDPSLAGTYRVPLPSIVATKTEKVLSDFRLQLGDVLETIQPYDNGYRVG
jgi:hypothetical protein